MGKKLWNIIFKTRYLPTEYFMLVKPLKVSKYVDKAEPT